MQKTPKVLSFPKHGECFWKQIAFRPPKPGEFFLVMGGVYIASNTTRESHFIIVPTFHAEKEVRWKKGKAVEA